MSAISTRVTPNGMRNNADNSATERTCRDNEMIAWYSVESVDISTLANVAEETSASRASCIRGAVRPPVTAYGRIKRSRPLFA